MPKKLITLLLLLAALPTAALAAETGGPIVTAWGPRVGFSSGPDQVVFGGQLDLGNLTPDITLTPNLDLGFGDNVTTISVNVDGHYHFRVSGSPWRPYVGLGIGFNHYSVDTPAGDFSDTEFGPSLVGGAIVPTQSGSRFFIEGKLGLTNDSPDFKLLVGWNFAL